LDFPLFDCTLLPLVLVDSLSLITYSRWNRVAILSGSWDIRISSLEIGILDCILHFPLIQLCCIAVSLNGLLNLKILGIVNGITLLFCLQIEINLFPFISRYLDLWLPVASDNSHNSFIGYLNVENKQWIAFGILFPSGVVKLKAYKMFKLLLKYFRCQAAILNLCWVLCCNHVALLHVMLATSCSPAILRNIIRAHPSTIWQQK